MLTKVDSALDFYIFDFVSDNLFELKVKSTRDDEEGRKIVRFGYD